MKVIRVIITFDCILVSTGPGILVGVLGREELASALVLVDIVRKGRDEGPTSLSKEERIRQKLTRR